MLGGLIGNTLILTFGELINKVLGLVIRIVSVRLIGDEGISLYMLVMPTFTLFMTLASMGFPIAISKLVAEETKDNKRLVFSIIPVSIILNIVLMTIIFLIAPILSSNLLQDNRTFYPILAISFVLPFITISSIIRGYFFGKQKMLPQVMSHITEQLVRLIIIIIAIPLLMNVNKIGAVSLLILSNAISEFVSILVLFTSLPKNFKIRKKDFKPRKDYVSDVLGIGIPATGSRLIGSFSYFLEPIILIGVASMIGANIGLLSKEYGIVSAYIMPLLLIPSFFTLAISQALIPIVSKNHVRGKNNYIKKRICQACGLSFCLGFISTGLILINPELVLKFIFNTTSGVKYLYMLAPVFLLFYIQAPITATLQAMGKAKIAMRNTLIAAITKMVLMIIISYFNGGIYALIIGITASICITTTLGIGALKKLL